MILGSQKSQTRTNRSAAKLNIQSPKAKKSNLPTQAYGTPFGNYASVGQKVKNQNKILTRQTSKSKVSTKKRAARRNDSVVSVSSKVSRVSKSSKAKAESKSNRKGSRSRSRVKSGDQS